MLLTDIYGANIGNVTSANLGPELITNGTFDEDLTGWSYNPSDWGHGDGTAICTQDGSELKQELSNITDMNKSYLLTFDFVDISNTEKVRVKLFNTNWLDVTETGSYQVIISPQFTSALEDNYIYFIYWSEEEVEYSGSIDNVSLKEILPTIQISNDSDTFDIGYNFLNSNESVSLSSDKSIVIKNSMGFLFFDNTKNEVTLRGYDPVTNNMGSEVYLDDSIVVIWANTDILLDAQSIEGTTLHLISLEGVGNRAVYSTSTGTLTNDSSDENLKTNIVPCEYGLQEVLQMEPIKFNWAQPAIMGSQTEVGFTAQSIRELVPEVIGMNANGTLSLDYPKLTAVLVKAIQELNDKLEGHINAEL